MPAHVWLPAPVHTTASVFGACGAWIVIPRHAFDPEAGINLLNPGQPLWAAHRDGFHHGNLVASIIANRPVGAVAPLGVLANHEVRLIPIVAAGGSALVVSHDLGLAARSCQRAVLLADGRLVAEGDPAEVFAPARLREVFGVEAELLRTADGAPVIVARRPAHEEREREPEVVDSGVR